MMIDADPTPTEKGLDYVSLVATVVLGAIGIFAIWMGNEEVATGVVGGIAGYMVRAHK